MERFLSEKRLREQDGQMDIQNSVQRTQTQALNIVKSKHEEVVAVMDEVRKSQRELQESGGRFSIKRSYKP